MPAKMAVTTFLLEFPQGIFVFDLDQVSSIFWRTQNFGNKNAFAKLWKGLTTRLNHTTQALYLISWLKALNAVRLKH